jgi:hypothetical protein
MGSSLWGELRVNNNCNYEPFQNPGFVASEAGNGKLIKHLSAVRDKSLACAGFVPGVSSLPSLIFKTTSLVSGDCMRSLEVDGFQ